MDGKLWAVFAALLLPFLSQLGSSLADKVVEGSSPSVPVDEPPTPSAVVILVEIQGYVSVDVEQNDTIFCVSGASIYLDGSRPRKRLTESPEVTYSDDVASIVESGFYVNELDQGVNVVVVDANAIWNDSLIGTLDPLSGAVSNVTNLIDTDQKLPSFVAETIPPFPESFKGFVSYAELCVRNASGNWVRIREQPFTHGYLEGAFPIKNASDSSAGLIIKQNFSLDSAYFSNDPTLSHLVSLTGSQNPFEFDVSAIIQSGSYSNGKWVWYNDVPDFSPSVGSSSLFLSAKPNFNDGGFDSYYSPAVSPFNGRSGEPSVPIAYISSLVDSGAGTTWDGILCLWNKTQFASFYVRMNGTTVQNVSGSNVTVRFTVGFIRLYNNSNQVPYSGINTNPLAVHPIRKFGYYATP